jgi:flagellar biosynthesis/type III secretory pathway protein FliH
MASSISPFYARLKTIDLCPKQGALEEGRQGGWEEGRQEGMERGRVKKAAGKER